MHAGSPLRDKAILVTGATGSFGTRFVERVLSEHEPRAIRLLSRDELKQSELQRQLGDDSRLRFLIGDVRSKDRLVQAMSGIDVVVHAAALKQVPACEYNPFEAVQTNVIGAENVIAAAIESGVARTLSLSTDKAVNPVNLYGATKLCAEKLFVQGNAYAGDAPMRFACARYGNVVGSRGSVIPLFARQAAEGELTITDVAMTRFWITLDRTVDFVVQCLERMQGGEIFVPRIPSMRITDLAEAIAPGTPHRIVGIRPGEKVHEVLITEDESRHATGFDDHFTIYPSFTYWNPDFPRGEALSEGFRYSSDRNDEWLSVAELQGLLQDPLPAAAATTATAGRTRPPASGPV